MKISLAQIDIAWKEKEKNLIKCEQLLLKANKEKADLVVFPEMTLTGFSMNVMKTGEGDFDIPSCFAKLAKRYGVHIGFGYAKHSEQDNKFKNKFCIVRRDGTVLGEYTKIHPFPNGGEKQYFKSGNQFNAFELEQLCFGLSIGYDLQFPEVFRILSRKTQCILIIANWPQEKREHWLALTKARAIENQCYIIAVNRCGQDIQNTYGGDSLVVDPGGNIVVQCNAEEQLVTVEINRDTVEMSPKRFSMTDDKNFLLYAREYEKIICQRTLPSMFLRDKVIVVTGGCGLLGKDIVSRIAYLGGTVVLADKKEEEAAKLANTISSEYYTDMDYFKTDITNMQSVDALVDYCVKKYGRIDGLINSAYPRNNTYGKKYEDIPLEGWKENIDLHLNGYYNVIHQMSKQMMKQQHGKIVIMGSIYGVVGPDFHIYDGTQMTMPAEYAAIKGALINLARYLASYLGKYHITVNCVSPGGIFDNQDPVFVKHYNEKVPLGRMGIPGDISGGIVYLLSDAADYVTGHNLMIDGGWSNI